MTLKLTDIARITKNPEGPGYLIVFSDGRAIHLHKKRTVPALLTLIRHGEGCEADLTNKTTNLAEIKNILAGKMSSNLIADAYSDANKPFSELWNEEGFVFITNPTGQTRMGSKKYVLAPEDHERLFTAAKKAARKAPPPAVRQTILAAQHGHCNLCNADILDAQAIDPKAFSKDRRRLVWDHRTPVEKGGASDAGNYQALCFYCNKCKWQVCNHCELDLNSCSDCALAHPERTLVIRPTREDIADRAPHHRPPTPP